MHNQHLCLFYLADKMSRTDLKNFYYKMCTVLHYDENKMFTYAGIYSSYGLFESTPLTMAEIKRLLKLSPCESCKKLIKNKKYSNLNIIDNACILCEYSEEYRNNRVTDESLLLRYLMSNRSEWFKVNNSPDLIFFSKHRICDDYAMGTYPIIQLNSFLFSFIENNEFELSNKEKFIELFISYICKYTVITIPPTLLQQKISLYIDDLLQLSLNTVSKDRFEHLLSTLSEDYIYFPSLGLSGEVDDSLVLDEEIIAEEEVLVEVITEEKEPSTDTDIIANQIDPGIYNPMEVDFKQAQVIATEHGYNLSYDNGELAMYSESNIEADTSSNTIETSIKEIEDNKFECPQENPKDVEQTEAIELVNSIYDINSFPIAFSEKIVTVTQKNIHLFLNVFTKSYFISVEPAARNGYIGLLFYCEYNKHFYFCDIELCGGKMLSKYFLSNDPRILSFHPMQVMAILSLYDGSAGELIGLDVLYGLLYEKKCSSYSILSDVLDKPLSECSTCQLSMPLYSQLFSILDVNAKGKDDIYDHYRKTLRLYNVLAKSLYLTRYSPDLSIGFTETTFLHYNFNFSWDKLWKKQGTIYRIEIPNLDCEKGFYPGTFVADICLIFYDIHHSYKEKTRILSITDKAIYIFYQGDRNEAQRFYDILMMALQRVFKQHFNTFLESKTYCTYYN